MFILCGSTGPVPSVGLSRYTVALSKTQGYIPSECEMVQWIIAKAVLFISKHDILVAAGPLQLCAGHKAGVEAGIYFVWSTFAEDTVEGGLLVNASNTIIL